uniref:Transmembrane protein n=1 Tax=Neospora caninum (strain Liverpool) TaxID=572307 RepID=F0JB45_NEOCL|nr:hypothetical protein NCLIV_069670 [Neospora caninum Liverpool]CEL71312.1 TPA: hypothetical protein BN1204_069670 [Neospora caninum Liverpool]
MYNSLISPQNRRRCVESKSPRSIVSSFPSNLPPSTSPSPVSPLSSRPQASRESGHFAPALQSPDGVERREDDKQVADDRGDEGKAEGFSGLPSVPVRTGSPSSGSGPSPCSPAGGSVAGSSVSCLPSPSGASFSPSRSSVQLPSSSSLSVSDSSFSLIGAAGERICLWDRGLLLVLVSLAAASPHFFRHALTTFQLFFSRDPRLRYTDFSHGLLFSLLELPAVPASLLAGLWSSARHTEQRNQSATDREEVQGGAEGNARELGDGGSGGGDEEEGRREGHERDPIEIVGEELGKRKAPQPAEGDASAWSRPVVESGTSCLSGPTLQSCTLVPSSPRRGPYPSCSLLSPRSSLSSGLPSSFSSRSSLPLCSSCVVLASVAKERASKRLFLGASLCWIGQVCFGVAISVFAFLPGAWLSVVLAGAGGAALVVLQRAAIVSLFPSSPAGSMAFSVACGAVAKTLGRVGPVFVASLLSNASSPPSSGGLKQEPSLGKGKPDGPRAPASQASHDSTPFADTADFDYRGLVVGTTLISGFSVLAAWGVRRVVRRLLVFLLAPQASRQREEGEEARNVGARARTELNRKYRQEQQLLAEPLLGSHTAYPEGSKEEKREAALWEKRGRDCTFGHGWGPPVLAPSSSPFAPERGGPREQDRAGDRSNTPSSLSLFYSVQNTRSASNQHPVCSKPASADFQRSSACFSSLSPFDSSSSSSSFAVSSLTGAPTDASTKFGIREQPFSSVLSTDLMSPSERDSAAEGEKRASECVCGRRYETEEREAEGEWGGRQNEAPREKEQREGGGGGGTRGNRGRAHREQWARGEKCEEEAEKREVRRSVICRPLLFPSSCPSSYVEGGNVTEQVDRDAVSSCSLAPASLSSSSCFSAQQSTEGAAEGRRGRETPPGFPCLSSVPSHRKQVDPSAMNISSSLSQFPSTSSFCSSFPLPTHSSHSSAAPPRKTERACESRETTESKGRQDFPEQATTYLARGWTEEHGERGDGRSFGEERARRERGSVAACLVSSRQMKINQNTTKRRPTERTKKIQQSNLRQWWRREEHEIRKKVGKLGKEFWSLVILHALIVAVGHCFLSFSSSIFHRVYKASITHAALYAALITVTTIVLLPALAYLVDRVGGSLLLVAVGMLLMWLVFCGTIALQPSPSSSAPASSLEPVSSASPVPSSRTVSSSSASIPSPSPTPSRRVLPLWVGGVFPPPAGGEAGKSESGEEGRWAVLTAILLGCAEALLPTVLMALVADKAVVPDPALYDVAFALMEVAKSVAVAAADATFGFLVDWQKGEAWRTLQARREEIWRRTQGKEQADPTSAVCGSFAS